MTGISLSAACPGTTPVDVSARIEGRANYRIVNTGSEDGLVNVVAELVDSAGNRTSDERLNLLAAAGQSFAVEHVLSLFVSYPAPGRIQVTMRVTVTGATSDSQSTDCGFLVE
jgi:hypothetical protein